MKFFDNPLWIFRPLIAGSLLMLSLFGGVPLLIWMAGE